MNSKSFSVVAVLALLLAASSLSAQISATASANAHANIISALIIIHPSGADLNFGDVVPGGTAGTVVVDPAAARTSTGGVLLGNGALVAAAVFGVAGISNAAYNITLPTSPITVTSLANNMTVTNFTSNPTGAGNTGAGGVQTLTVGGTLNVAINQPIGAYTGTFDVTVTLQ